MTEYDNLWKALHGAADGPPEELAMATAALPEVGHLPLPWATWALIALVRHRRRQLWVAEVVKARLSGDLEAIATMGAFGHPPEVPPQGLVPGLTEWEYEFHGKGCRLTHRGTGELIDVDFYGPTGEYIDLFFYRRYLRSLRTPESPEARLIALHPSLEPIRLAVAELLGAGMLLPLEDPGSHLFRVAEAVIDHEDTIDAFCNTWESGDSRVWTAAVVGDWPAAHQAALATNDPGLVERAAARAAACHARRCRDLLADGAGGDRPGDVLLALDDLDAAPLADRLGHALRGPIGGETSTALTIIARRDDSSWCPEIHDLFRRLDPDAPLPQAYLWAECQRFLLRHGFRADEMRPALDQAWGIAVGEAALLALEHAPDRALSLFRRALRSPIPINRTNAAAALALIDRPWSRRELLAVLSESDDQEATSECRAALLECHDEGSRLAVEAWEAAHPHEPEPGPWITMREMALRNCAAWIRSEMETLHDRVLPLRNRVPVEPPPVGRGPIGRLADWLRRRL